MSNLDNHEIQECVREGERRAIIGIFEKMYKDLYKEKPNYQMAMLDSKLDDLREKNRKDWVLLTINPKEDTESMSLVEIAMNIGRRSWIENMDYGVEGVNSGKHIHIHMLFHLKKNYSPGQIVQMLMRHKGIVGMVGSAASIDVKKIYRWEVERTRKYIHKENIMVKNKSEEIGSP